MLLMSTTSTSLKLCYSRPLAVSSSRILLNNYWYLSFFIFIPLRSYLQEKSQMERLYNKSSNYNDLSLDDVSFRIIDYVEVSNTELNWPKRSPCLLNIGKNIHSCQEILGFTSYTIVANKISRAYRTQHF